MFTFYLDLWNTNYSGFQGLSIYLDNPWTITMVHTWQVFLGKAKRKIYNMYLLCYYRNLYLCYLDLTPLKRSGIVNWLISDNWVRCFDFLLEWFKIRHYLPYLDFLLVLFCLVLYNSLSFYNQIGLQWVAHFLSSQELHNQLIVFAFK